MKKTNTLVLPSRQAISQSIDNGTHEDYHLVRLYYSWYAGWFYRQRLQMVANLLDGSHIAQLLEVGTGSGIFIKQLLTYADHVSGIDIHASYNGVKAMLSAEQIPADRVTLQYGSILEIPFPDSTFDTAVCVSVLEHFEDPRPAIREIRRVVKPGGMVVLGFPVRSAFTSSLFGMLGYRAHDIHPADHATILAGVRDVLTLEQVNRFPFGLFPMYIACKARRSQES